MANSFEPLVAFAPLHEVAGGSTVSAPPPAPPAQPWFTALAEIEGFRPDPRFARPEDTSAQDKEDEAQQLADAVLADALADAERRGREAALAEIASEGAARAALKLSLQRLDDGLQEQLATRLAETVAALCESALAPMALDRDALQRRCIAAAARVGEGIVDASLRLHPDDIALLDGEFASTWHIVAAPELERGSVVFDMPEGAVSDGPAEWRASLREALDLC